eukprot:5038288-Amphidinium_carterae.1
MPLTALIPTEEMPDWTRHPPADALPPAHAPLPMEIDSDSCPLNSLLAGERLGEARHPGPNPPGATGDWRGHAFRKAHQP